MTLPTRTELQDCEGCPLAGDDAVKGECPTLDTMPDIMVIGEAPGEYEQLTGRPFVGKTGQLLRRVIAQASVANPYITNMVKHRPPNNRDPLPEELEACRPFLDREIAAVQPKAIVLVGRFAARLAFPRLNMAKSHGRWGTVAGIPAVAMYHPSFWMRKTKQVQETFFSACVAMFQQAQLIAEGKPDPMPHTEYSRASEIPRGQWTVDCEADGPDARVASMRLFVARGADGALVGEPGTTFAPGSTLRCHNSAYDTTTLLRHGLDPYSVEWDDTRVVAHVARLPDTSMKGLSSRLIGQPVPSYIERFGDPTEIWNVPFDDLAQYCAWDTILTDQIWDYLQQKLDPWVWDVYNDIERPLLPIVAEMTAHGGFDVDIPLLTQYHYQQTGALYHAVRTFKGLAGVPDHPCTACGGSGRVPGKRKNTTKKCPDCKATGWSMFNLNSDDKMADLLYGKLKLPTPRRKTPSGSRYTVDDAALAGLQFAHPAIPILRRASGIHKELTTYVMTYLNKGRITAEWDQTGTETGRFSSRDENLQNVPESLRRFCMRVGHTLVSGDYSQVEYRVAAHLSQDPDMLDAYRRGMDMHDLVAQRFGVPRRTAKVYNFGGLLFGGDEHTIIDAGLKQNVQISKADARQFLSEAKDKFPRYYDWCVEMAERAEETGWVEGLYGRRFYIDGWDTASRPHEWAAVARKAVNYPIQGGAADIVKRAMVRVRKLGRPLLAQVHDEITVAVPPGWEQAYAEEFERALVAEQPLDVPITAEVRTSDYWK